LPIFTLVTVRRLAWRVRLGLRVLMRALLLALSVLLLRSLPGRAWFMLAFLPVVPLLAVAAAVATIAAAVARLPGALPPALVALRLVRLRRCLGCRSALEPGNDLLLDAPVDQALDRGQ
jgi:hypothetical protein